MSVVNKMLRDLEGRSIDTATADYQPQSRQFNWGWLFAASLALVGAAALWQLGLVDALLNNPAPATNQSEPLVVRAAEQTPAVQDAEGVNAEQSDLAKPSGESAGTQKVERPLIKVQPEPERTTEKQLATVEPVSGATSEALEGSASLEAPREVNANVEDLESSQQSQLSISSQETPEVIALRRQVKAAIDVGDEAQQTSALQQWLKLEPGNTKVRAKLSSLQFGSGNPSSAEALLRDGIALSPDNPLFPMMLARLYRRQQQAQSALALLLRHQFNSVEYLELRASTAQEVGDYRSAQNDYQQLVSLAPMQSRFWLGLGISADQLTDVLLATTAYKRVRQLGASAEVDAFVSDRLRALGG